ncbi:MAG: hypothetical protein Q7J27_02580 [Syntrophales bacterium]|nr:hypothetical protein [Syntrophales bacterium]
MNPQSQEIDWTNLPEPKTGRGPKNIPLETLIELYKKKLSHAQIGKVTGCSASNVTMRLKRAGITTLRDYKKNRADVFAIIQGKIINSVSPLDIKKASLLQKATAIGIMYDKERLERGESTENISIHADIKALREGAQNGAVKAKTIAGEGCR